MLKLLDCKCCILNSVIIVSQGTGYENLKSSKVRTMLSQLVLN